MTAADRAKLMCWDVDCVPASRRNQSGVKIAIIINGKNVASLIEAERQRKGLERLRQVVEG